MEQNIQQARKNKQKYKKIAIASLSFGFLSVGMFFSIFRFHLADINFLFLISFVSGILAIIFGIMTVKSSWKVLSIIGIILGSLSLLVFIFSFVVAFMISEI
jgi:hypothetical protein